MLFIKLFNWLELRFFCNVAVRFIKIDSFCCALVAQQYVDCHLKNVQLQIIIIFQSAKILNFFKCI